jgi:molybdenum cofactor cytidylyltransferase
VIAAVVLAAGSSRRMGRPKLTLELGGKSLIERTVERAESAGLGEIVVVTGPETPSIKQALAGARARLVYNPDHLTGMAGSLRIGLQAVSPETEAVVVLLGDQPFQDHTVIERLVETYRSTGKPIVVPRYAGRRGNPVLFERTLFAELTLQEGDQGGRAVIEADPGRVATVDFETALPQRDLDTWDDYLAARAELGEG